MKSKFPITWVLVAFALLAVKISNAQSTGFKLSDYKNPDYLYRTLDLNFGLNSGLTARNPLSYSNSSFNSLSINSEAGAVYSRYKNSPQMQAESHLSFNAGIGYSDYKYNLVNSHFTRNTNSFSHGENLNMAGLKRFYNEKQQYLEFSGSLSGRYNGLSDNVKTVQQDTTSLQAENRQKNLAMDVTGAFLAGKGRIEQVQDARLAMYILDDLQKLNRQKRIASDEEVLAFAREITSLKYKRFFDNRLRKIAEITAIDAFLQKNGLAGISDAAYFTSLNDNWDFANNPIRYSGKRLYTGLVASYGFHNSSLLNKNLVPASPEEEDINKGTNGSLFLVAGIDYERPKSLTWQNSATLKVGIGMQSRIQTLIFPGDADGITIYTGAIPAITLSSDYGFGYYPNSRTWVTLKWWLLSGWNKEMEGDSRQEKEDSQNRFYTYTGPQFNAYYYLSEKLRLSLTFNGEFRFDNQKFTYTVTEGNPEKVTDTWWNQQLNASLTYSLF